MFWQQAKHSLETPLSQSFQLLTTIIHNFSSIRAKGKNYGGGGTSSQQLSK
jgi:hypothetical protein